MPGTCGGIRMRLHSKRLSQSGDTIVEVLIAVAIVSSVLAGAFTVSQKSALAVRDSQERGEMLQLLQGQVELVRAQALQETSATSGVFAASPKYFCMNQTSHSRENLPTTTNPLPDLDNDSLNAAVYGSYCSDLGTSGSAVRYNVAITYNTTDKVFNFTGRWDGVGGRKDQTQLSYRIYPGRL